jgi:hypothetical protein
MIRWFTGLDFKRAHAVQGNVALRAMCGVVPWTGWRSVLSNEHVPPCKRCLAILEKRK